jgi:hypothetical protein
MGPTVTVIANSPNTAMNSRAWCSDAVLIQMCDA